LAHAAAEHLVPAVRSALLNSRELQLVTEPTGAPFQAFEKQ
jgi:hypothetical protein